MTNMVTATVRIKGKRPILWHKFGPDSIPLEKQEKSGVPGHNPVEWRKTVLYTKDEGQLYIRPDYVFSCLVEASKHTRKGRGSIQKLVAATLQVEDEKVLIDRYIPGYDGELPESITDDDTQPVYLDIRGVVNPSTRGRNVRYRVAASKGWETEFTLLWDCTIVSREQMQAVLHDAGNLVGLGNGRVVGFGRFDVLELDLNE